jgi:hypothetical protein
MAGDAEETVKAIKMALFRSIIQDTPVDTGRLAGNWQSTLNSPASGESSAMGKATAISGINPGKASDTAFLTNNLPYAARIEFEGWSHTKAPQGMVRRNVNRIAAIIRNRSKINGALV